MKIPKSVLAPIANCRMALAILALAPLCAAAETVVIAPVNVVSMITGTVAGERAVIVQDGIIRGVTAHADAPGPDPGTRVIDGQGGWVIPGLAEMHAHIPRRDRGEQHARDILTLFLAHGVTTVRGMLGEPWHLELRDLLGRQEWKGPRLITSGPSFNGNTVVSPEQAAQRAREQAAAGYDFLKLHPGLEADEFEAIARTARELGIPIAGHVSFGVGLDAALRARQATIDHLDGYAQAMVPPNSALAGEEPSWFGLNLALEMDPQKAPELAMSTALAGVWNVPTQSLFESTAGTAGMAELMGRPGMQYVSPGLRARWKSSVENIRSRSTPDQRGAFIAARRALILALQDARAGLLLGSDAPQIMNVPGISVHQELAYLVAAGLTPLQALQSGTVNVARFFGYRDQGEVAVGNVADFILLERNPLQDIGATTGISGVMRAGEWYDRALLDRMLEDVRGRGL